uniref:Ribonuclease H-like domain-containing protein n=1 Tax=Tanacetum cinerariifolium TaxID=118510 RepID=A0A699GW87_TANCI|nr:ribonuclease H-like domain-containing protein [Tanacetum cinerariifolium]
MIAKLPILNPGEYDLWLMRIEQYLLMTDYSLWEVIKNGNKVLTKLVRSSEQTYEPTTAEEKQDRRYDMNARGTLLMALPNKDQLKIIKHKSKYIDFVSSNNSSSTNEADTTASRPNTPQLAKEDLEQIDLDDLEEMDLHWEIAMLTIRARRFMKRTGMSLIMNGQRIGFDKTKVECFNCHKHGHFARECRAPKKQDNRGREYGRTIVTVETLTENALIAQDGLRGDKSKSGLGYKKLIPKSFVNSSELLEKQNNRLSKGYHEVPPPLTGNYIPPPKRDMGLIDEHFESESVDVSTVSSNADKTVKIVDITHKGVLSTEEPKSVMKNNFGPPIIKDWHSDDDSEEELSPIVEVKTVKPSVEKIESVKNPKDTGNPQQKEYKEKGVTDNGCSRHMTGKKCYLTDFKAFDGGLFSFGDGKGRIYGKGKIKTGKLDFNDVYFCKELKYNLFSVSQMCDKKNNVLFTDTECLVLSSNFKLLVESQVLLRVIRKDNIYSVDLKSVVPTGGLTCLFAKATLDESNLWHMRLGHFNFKTMNKLIKGNLAEAINTACYVLNRALVPKPHNKIPYELIRRRPPLIDFIKPFGCHVTILNTGDNIGKFEGKADEGYFVGPDWIFDIDSFIISMNYVPVVTGNQTNDAKDSAKGAGKKAPEVDAGEALDNGGQDNHVSKSEDGSLFQQDIQTEHNNSTNEINTISSPVSTAGPSFVNDASQIPLNVVGPSASTNAFEEHSFERFSPFKNAFSLPHVPMVTLIDDTRIFDNAYDDDVLGEEVDMNNVDSSYTIPEATKNKKDERGIMIKNKARLVAHGHTQEEGIYYDEVFAPVARIEAIRLFLAYASFKYFVVYQMNVKSVFLYGKIEEEKELSTKFEKLMHDKFQMSSMGELSFFLGLQVKQKSDGIFISQDKYVAEILKKFDFVTVKTTSTPMKSNKPLIKDEEAEDVDVHLYRSMIGSLMYLIASRPDITFAVCACARFQVTPKTSHLHAVKRIFRYLKGQPKLRIGDSKGWEMLCEYIRSYNW